MNTYKADGNIQNKKQNEVAQTKCSQNKHSICNTQITWILNKSISTVLKYEYDSIVAVKQYRRLTG